MGQQISSSAEKQNNEITKKAGPDIISKTNEKILKNPKKLLWSKNNDGKINLYYGNLIFNTKECSIFAYNYNKSLEKFLNDFSDEVMIEIIEKKSYIFLTLSARHPSGAFCRFEIGNFKNGISSYIINNITTKLNPYGDGDGGLVFFNINNDTIYVKFPDERYRMAQIIIDQSKNKCYLKDLSGEFSLGEYSIYLYVKDSINEYGYHKVYISESNKYISKSNWEQNDYSFKLNYKFVEQETNYWSSKIAFKNNVRSSIYCLNAETEQNKIKSSANEHLENNIIQPIPTAPVLPTEFPEIEPIEPSNIIIPDISELPPIPFSAQDLTTDTKLQSRNTQDLINNTPILT